MLVLAMSWPAIVWSPDTHAGDKAPLPTVVNGHMYELEEKWRACVKAKRYLDSVASPYLEISKDNVKWRKLHDRNLKKATNDLNKAKRQYIEARKWWFYVEEDIREYKTNDPVGYQELSTLIGGNGHVIYVFILRTDYVRDTGAVQDTNGATHWAFCKKHNQFYIPKWRKSAPNDAFLVCLKKSATNVGKIIAHEQGHIIDMLEHPLYYMDHQGEWNELDCQDSRNSTHPMVIPAKAAEDSFINRLNRIKYPYVRNTYNKQQWLARLDSTLLAR